MNKNFKRVMAQLETFGLLLQTDPFLPSVCTIVTGEGLRGSWWAHPLAQDIFAVNEMLEDHPDVLITKLVSGKVTFVHKKLWAELFAIGNSREEWQERGLTDSSRHLLKLVDAAGEVRTDKIKWPPKIQSKQRSPAARELERRLLVNSRQLHTESGAHAKILETWERWAKRATFKPAKLSSTEARKRIEALVQKLNQESGGDASLPWLTKNKQRK